MMLCDIDKYEIIANNLNIEYNKNHWCEKQNMHLMDVINSWYSLLRFAHKHGIIWEIGKYEPITLYDLVKRKINSKRSA